MKTPKHPQRQLDLVFDCTARAANDPISPTKGQKTKSGTSMHDHASRQHLQVVALSAMTVNAPGTRPKAVTSEINGWIVAIGARFKVDVEIEMDAHGVTRFRFLYQGWLHRFATIEKVEAYLTRATGLGSVAALKVNRGHESRCTMYRDAQRKFEANGDLEVAAVFAKRLKPRPILPNALDMALARLRHEAR
jgi:hypothetical protein